MWSIHPLSAPTYPLKDCRGWSVAQLTSVERCTSDSLSLRLVVTLALIHPNPSPPTPLDMSPALMKHSHDRNGCYIERLLIHFDCGTTRISQVHCDCVARRRR
ncbi:unnamed protein product [Pleuronectes platessa]|uniref:Uncharacterized protein n=1 Tax=Pleuronectes platessa TaxID=8262 RepID=A0A9N7VSF1_PLEPL|nr:unnamed protein product [Pleuronectes platessa]